MLVMIWAVAMMQRTMPSRQVVADYNAMNNAMTRRPAQRGRIELLLCKDAGMQDMIISQAWAANYLRCVLVV